MSIGHIVRGIRHPVMLLVAILALTMSAALACTTETADDATATDSDMTSSMTGDMSTVLFDRSNDGIWVTGAGRVSVTPDIATLRVGVETSDESVGAAMSEAAQSMQAVVDSLTAAGIDEDDIQTLNFSVSPRYEWNETLRRSEMVGFSVTNTVRATVRDLDTIADVIDGAVSAGGDNARVDGLSFGVDDTAEAERGARELAMAAALEQATQLASSAGVELGDPFHISESGAAPLAQDTPELARSVAQMAADDAASTPILAGEQDVVIYVRVGYEIG